MADCSRHLANREPGSVSARFPFLYPLECISPIISKPSLCSEVSLSQWSCYGNRPCSSTTGLVTFRGWGGLRKMSQGNSILPKWSFKLKSSALQPSLLKPRLPRAAVKVGGPARLVALSKRVKPLRGKVICWEELCSGLFYFFSFLFLIYQVAF